MGGHTDPSIDEIISNCDELDKKYSDLNDSLIASLKRAFAENIPFPTATEADILYINDTMARYINTLEATEFIEGAVNALDPRWRINHPEETKKVHDLVKNVVEVCLQIMISSAPFYYATVGSNGIYISAGACFRACSAKDWAPIKNDFYAVVIVLAVWSRDKPYPGYPEPVRIAPPVYR